MLEWLRQEEVRGYRYEANTAITWFLIVSGLVALCLALALWIRSGLAHPIHQAGFAVLVIFSLWVLGLVARWSLFVARSYVGVSPRAILVGTGSRADLIPRSRLNRDTILMDRMMRGRLTSVLPIEIGAFRREILLIGPMANLQKPQHFISEVLESILVDEEDSPSVS